MVRRFRQEGDLLAFEAIVAKYQQPLYNFTLRLLGNPEDAQDATQHTFIQAYEALPHARPESPLRPWLFQVARNKAIDLIRRRRSLALSALKREGVDQPAFDAPGPSYACACGRESKRIANVWRDSGDYRSSGHTYPSEQRWCGPELSWKAVIVP